MLDTARAVETPEGVTIQLRVAGLIVRTFGIAHGAPSMALLGYSQFIQDMK